MMSRDKAGGGSAALADRKKLRQPEYKAVRPLHQYRTTGVRYSWTQFTWSS